MSSKKMTGQSNSFMTTIKKKSAKSSEVKVTPKEAVFRSYSNIDDFLASDDSETETETDMSDQMIVQPVAFPLSRESDTHELLQYIEYVKQSKIYNREDYRHLKGFFKKLIKIEENIREIDDMIGMKTFKYEISRKIIKIIRNVVDDERFSNMDEDEEEHTPEPVTSTESETTTETESSEAEIIEDLSKNLVRDAFNKSKLLAVAVKRKRQTKRRGGKTLYNTALYGSPGTGKTTIAHLMAKLFLKIGILSKSEVIVGNRANMIGEYLGQTAPKTEKVLKSALGGVLLLDEVYQFGAARDGNRDSFAKEFIDTVNQFITEHEGELVIIVAGYEEQVRRCFFAQNEGLPRRFPYSYTLEKYGPSELAQILRKQALAFEYEMPDTIANDKFFEKNMELFEFGGGDTKSFLDKCIEAYQNRTVLDMDREYVFNKDDVKEALRCHIQNKTSNKELEEKKQEKQLMEHLYS